MRIACVLWLLVSPLLALNLPGSNVTRAGSIIRIGSSDRGSISKGHVGRGNSGVIIGGSRFSNSTRQRSLPTTTTTTTTAPSARFTYAPQSSVGNNYNITGLKVSPLGASSRGDSELK